MGLPLLVLQDTLAQVDLHVPGQSLSLLLPAMLVVRDLVHGRLQFVVAHHPALLLLVLRLAEVQVGSHEFLQLHHCLLFLQRYFVVTESFVPFLLKVPNLLELDTDVFFVKMSLLVDHPCRND